MTNLDSILKSRDITLPTKFCLVNAIYDFSSSHVWMWKLDHKESWALRNWFFWTVVLEKTLESPFYCKEMKPVNPKGNNPEYSLEGLMLKLQYFWPAYGENWLIRKDPDAGKDWRQVEKGVTVDEMVEWHHWLNEHEFEQVLGVGDEQESLAWCSPLGDKESDTTEGLNWTEHEKYHIYSGMRYEYLVKYTVMNGDDQC